MLTDEMKQDSNAVFYQAVNTDVPAWQVFHALEQEESIKRQGFVFWINPANDVMLVAYTDDQNVSPQQMTEIKRFITGFCRGFRCK